jgi:hypothetical protein
MAWLPRPTDTSSVVLPKALDELVEVLAEEAHANWAAGRMAGGWRYGPKRDDDRLTHPDLVPYSDLPETEKEFDRELAMTTLRLVVSRGYRILPPEEQ